MRLLRCHIENFGKLHDFTLELTGNLTVINENNGWGKSTLAAFIKVMFYGLANEKKRGDMLERERVRFRPWQGGVFGGELEFEAGGRRYLMNRTFGAKEADDTFALYDAATNLVSEDFSSNIGEELFQINQESFLRTIYIAQNDCATGTTDSINAKVGNLADNLDDINNYEKVQQVLKDLRNSLTPARKTGELRKLKDEIDELKNEMRKGENLNKTIAELEERLAKCGGEKEAALARQKSLQEELIVLGRQREIEAKKEHYDRILRQCRERQAAMEDCARAFGGSVPVRSKLQEAMDRRNIIVQQESALRANALSSEERAELEALRARFGQGLPGEELSEQGIRLSEQLEGLRREAAQRGFSAEEEREAEQLESRFGGVDVSEEDIDHCLQQWNLRSEIKSGLGTKRAALSSLRMAEDGAASARGNGRGRRAGNAIFLPPLCLILIGLALCFLKPPVGVGLMIAGVGLMAAGAVSAAVLLVIRATGGRRDAGDTPAADSRADALEAEIAEDEEAMRRAQDQVLDFLGGLGLGDAIEGQGVRDSLYALKNDLKRLNRFQARRRDYQAFGYEERIGALERELYALLEPYCNVEEIRRKSPRELLLELENRREFYLRLETKEEKHRGAEEECARQRAALEAFFSEFGQAEVRDEDMCLQSMARRLAGYENDAAELKKSEDERREFEQNNDMSSFGEPVSGSSRGMEEVRAELQALGGQLEALGESRNSYLVQLDERQQEAEQLELKQERLAQLKEQYDKKYRYYCNLERTSEYLAKAKESFSARYMEPIMDAFRRNYELMSSISGEDFRIDANIRITKREEGDQRDTRALSAGAQDLVGIALRMALIEAMYRKEPPFLIFDDAFTNLDAEKLEHAKIFLRSIAEKYQVIYFTCHESRA